LKLTALNKDEMCFTLSALATKRYFSSNEPFLSDSMSLKNIYDEESVKKFYVIIDITNLFIIILKIK
jgi:hypothetical protein